MQPVFVNNNPSGISEQIVWLVKNSGLNFSIQETAFSLNIQLKKTFLNQWTKTENVSNSNFTNQAHQEVVHELHVKEKQIHDLEKALEEERTQTEKASENLAKSSANKVKALNDEKKSIQIKHEKMCVDHKILKADNLELKKDLNALNVALKSSKKENNDNVHKNRKKVEDLEENVKELVEFKLLKESEEKDLRIQTKKVERKLKSIQEKEAELKVAKNRLERSKLGKSEATDHENNNSEDKLTDSKDSSCVEAYGCEVKDSVIEAPMHSDFLGDALNDAIMKESEDVKKETSENCEFKPVSTLSTSNSSGSEPLTKRDLEDMWNSFAEENGYQTIKLT